MNELFQQLPTLETPRLILRKLVLNDAEDIFKFTSIDSVTDYLTWFPHKDIAVTKEFLEMVMARYESGEPSQWAIFHKESQSVIGIIGFIDFSEEHGKGELAYVLSPDFQRLGLMKEALISIIDYSFSKLGLNRIQCKLIAGNNASEMLLKSVGMVKEGEFRQFLRVKGELKNFIYYSILKQEFKQIEN